ncbi:MAG: hypothetical protein IPJ18_19815 [Betaproteobacteria bacterium]|nr:hypothetical protein [Betaproteobacteria bacterium]
MVAPIVTSIDHQTPTSSPTNADSLTFRVTFSKAVSGVDTADFTVSGTTATVASVTQVGSTNDYDVLLSGGDLASVNGSVTMAFAGGQNIADTATTPNALTVTTPTGTNNHTYVLDNAAPTLTINTVAGDDRVNGTEDDSAVTVSGTTTVEDGQVVAVSVGALNKTAPVTTGAWSVSLSSTEVQGLTTGNVAITADVSDATGNAATQATKTVVYDPSATLIVNTELDSGDDATLGASLSADMADGGGLSLREALH